MKKYLIALFAFAPVLCFGDDLVIPSTGVVQIVGYYYNSSTATSPTLSGETKRCLLSDLPFAVLNLRYAARFTNNFVLNTPNPNLQTSIYTNSSRSVNYPISYHGQYYALANNAPSFISMLQICGKLFASGFTSSGFTTIHQDSSGYTLMNIRLDYVLADVLQSTNLQWRAEFLSGLSSINSNLSSIDSRLQQIINIIPSDSVDYSTLSNRISSLAAASGINDLYFDSASALNALDLSNYDTSDPDFPGYYNAIATSYDRALKVASALSGLSALHPEIGAQSGFNQFAKDFGNSFGAGAAGHYTTPLTNQMHRMSTDWVNETKAALSNNTQKIKDDLAAWKNQLHGTQTSIDNSAANINNTLNNIANGSSVVRVDLGSVEFGVTLSGPVTIDPTQFNAFSEDLGKAGDYMERLFNEFKWWAWDSPDSWKKGFLDRDLSRLSSNVQEQVSLQHSISNLLADFAFNFTNNTEFAISNALAGFTFSSTNDYLLLSDYVDYIRTSGLSDLLGVLDDDSYSDLKDELSSIGADDVSAGYGRWWRYYTGLSTIQANSVFKIANLLLDHEKLLKDLKRENTDVVELSDPNVFSELLSKIPSQTHIDNKISELTNSIDQSGFARIRELIPDLTNLLSVASALYDHDFALPTDISFVLIPSDSELNIKERVVHISPSEHYRVFQVLHYGIAFSYCLVNLILLPKFLLLLVRLFDRVWNKSERLIYNSTQS